MCPNIRCDFFFSFTEFTGKDQGKRRGSQVQRRHDGFLWAKQVSRDLTNPSSCLLFQSQVHSDIFSHASMDDAFPVAQLLNVLGSASLFGAYFLPESFPLFPACRVDYIIYISSD